MPTFNIKESVALPDLPDSLTPLRDAAERTDFQAVKFAVNPTGLELRRLLKSE